MSSSAHIFPHRYVRALNGDLEGKIFPVGRLLKIGRTPTADLQLLDDGVSRKHAQIRRTANGRDQLEDLGSTNGTMVDELKIRRLVLAPGMTFSIGTIHFIYEEQEFGTSYRKTANSCEANGAGIVQAQAFRRTTAYPFRRLALLDPEVAPPGREPDAPLPRQAPVKAETTHTVKAPHLFLVEGPEKAPQYRGDLVADILDYRAIRTRMIRGELLGRRRLAQLSDLETRLRCIPSLGGVGHEKRSFRRYSCRLHAELKLETGEAHSVMLVELGADGVRLNAPGHHLEPGIEVTLSIELTLKGRPTTVIFPSKVAWVDGSHAGLQFSRAIVSSWHSSRRSNLQTQALPVEAPCPTRISRRERQLTANWPYAQ